MDTRPASTPVFSSDEEINSPLNLESVLVTVRRFHSRYHSCLAALLYLFDLQVDRLTSVTLRLVAELKAVEDALLFSAAEHSFAAMAQQPAPMNVESVLSVFTNLEKVNSIVGGVRGSEG